MTQIENTTIEAIVQSKGAQTIIQSPDFYFQKGQDALNSWQTMEVSDELKNRLLQLSEDYDQIQETAKEDPKVHVILELLFEIIAYCDIRARNKNFYNQYDDKRCLAEAAVRMNTWVQHLILFKFQPERLPKGSTSNAFNYLLNPEHNTTILSENHRELIAKNLLGKEFDSSTFVIDLKAFFAPFHLSTNNPLNYTHLLSHIIYSITDKWKEEVVALMAADNTGWQDDHIEEAEGYKASIIWNSKRPSGIRSTLKFLRNRINEGNSFNLYYSKKGNVNYKATIIDFAENQQELDEKKWSQHYELPYYYTNFGDYADDKKSASIIFLAERLEKIIPIPVTEFKLYKDYSFPTQDNLSPLKYEPETVVEQQENITSPEKTNMPEPSLNQILYGPPGTGKTYNTINKALEIVGESVEGKTRKAIKELFDGKLKEGQIAFITFHQSMSYEDFIEGIKPIEPKKEGQPVIYRTESGIFKTIATKARDNKELSLLKTDSKLSAPFDIVFERLKEEIDNALLTDPVTTENEKTKGLVIPLLSSFFSITGINGTSIKMMTRTGNEQNTMTKPTLQLIYENPDSLDEHIAGGMRTYYRALVAKMKEWEPEVKSSAKKVELKNYVIIIDEINRGNVSQIFGELITLIEDDKRLGKAEALEVTLPYSKEKFGVPPNLYIIGTMNTADRSVEALDAALRRRFSFEEMPPLPHAIVRDSEPVEIEGINLPLLLTTINQRIEKLLDKDHQVGHSYLMSVDSMEKLQNAFYNKIIPLLQEYFFGSYDKIGLVLGDGFVRLKEAEQHIFADFDSESAADFEERPVYEIVDYRKDSHGHRLTINKQDIDMTFEKAIRRLMQQDIG